MQCEGCGATLNPVDAHLSASSRSRVRICTLLRKSEGYSGTERRQVQVQQQAQGRTGGIDGRNHHQRQSKGRPVMDSLFALSRNNPSDSLTVSEHSDTLTYMTMTELFKSGAKLLTIKITVRGPAPVGGSYTSTAGDETLNRLCGEGWLPSRVWQVWQGADGALFSVTKWTATGGPVN